MADDDLLPSRLTRRRVLYLAGAGASSVILAACSDDGAGGETVASDANPADGELLPSCVLTPDEAEGPFYADLELDRRDITDGRPGSPLELRVSVVNAETCRPITSAFVDVWHADASGLYSSFTGQGDDGDVDTSAESFLRGVQETNAAGIATFETIYPGWYPGRTTHIHAKVHFANQTTVTTQLYFPDDVSASVYASHEAYRDRGPKDTSNDDDGLGADLAGLRLGVVESASGHVATITIGIDRGV